MSIQFFQTNSLVCSIVNAAQAGLTPEVLPWLLVFK